MTLSRFHIRSILQRRLLNPRLQSIRLLVCDVDGVLTDGGLHYDEQGLVSKRFDVRDGLAMRMLQRAGITVALLSGGRSGAIEQRARHLEIEHCYVGIGDKLNKIQSLGRDLALMREHIAFLGDDLNDLAVRPAAGLLVATADAARPLRRQADWVLSRPGGHGAVRELAEALLASRHRLAEVQRDGWRDSNG
jgi:3-deoxy-D-manno-octulosonate 8-phosphate phosphatase (KDO 8-P phosphatase)